MVSLQHVYLLERFIWASAPVGALHERVGLVLVLQQRRLAQQRRRLCAVLLLQPIRVDLHHLVVGLRLDLPGLI